MSKQALYRLRETAKALLGRHETASRVGRHVGRWLVLGLLIAVTIVIVSPFFYLEGIRLEQGQVVSYPIRSQVPFEFDDPDELRRWEQARESEYQRVYRYDSRVEDAGAARLRVLMAEAGAVNLTPADLESTATATVFAAKIEGAKGPDGKPIGVRLGQRALQTLIARRNQPQFERDIESILRDVYRRGVVFDKNLFLSHISRLELVRVAKDPAEEFTSQRVLDYPQGVAEFLNDYLRGFFRGTTDAPMDSPRAAAREILQALLEPNLIFDREASLQNKMDYRVGYEQVHKTLDVGNVLFDPGQIITEREATIIKLYNEHLRLYVTRRLAGNIGFVLLATAILGFFAWTLRTEFTFTAQTMLLAGLPLIAALGFERLLILVTGGADALNPLAGYAFPAGMIGMICVLLLDVRLALVLVTCGCLLFGLQVDLQFSYVAVALFGGFTAVGALYTIRERRELILAGLKIALINAAAILMIEFIREPLGFPWKLATVGAINGLVCPLITIALLPVFEVMFGVVTDVRLLELTGLDHELTRRLEREAPGTWQHTLNVSKLAESGAQAIGVNHLLVRAGAYFHDVGKLRKPPYFTENQASAEDKRRHQELRPQMSILIIRDHVKSGIEMAREAGLPEKIIDFIPQHHGTSLIKYFYVKAVEAFKEGRSKEPVREDDYRYPGPKPQSRETAIVMLADAVEATATAKLTGAIIREDDIQRVVRDTVVDKFNDGQFDECDLTLRDLQAIREAFVGQLVSRFHTRIDYPKMPDKQPPSSAPAVPKTKAETATSSP